jgi:hypothetical protein
MPTGCIDACTRFKKRQKLTISSTSPLFAQPLPFPRAPAPAMAESTAAPALAESSPPPTVETEQTPEEDSEFKMLSEYSSLFFKERITPKLVGAGGYVSKELCAKMSSMVFPFPDPRRSKFTIGGEKTTRLF